MPGSTPTNVPSSTPSAAYLVARLGTTAPPWLKPDATSDTRV